MDEATSALDNKTEAEVMQAINNLKQNRTLIMIAHRLTTVEACDRLYYLDRGTVEASGNYAELMDQVPLLVVSSEKREHTPPTTHAHLFSSPLARQEISERSLSSGT